MDDVSGSLAVGLMFTANLFEQQLKRLFETNWYIVGLLAVTGALISPWVRIPLERELAQHARRATALLAAATGVKLFFEIRATSRD